MNLFDLSALLMIAFALLSMVDGVYLHLIRYRLHARPETRREHIIHGLRGLLLIPTLVLVLSGTTSGPWLWLGLGFVAVDVLVTIADVREERGSRDFQGGLPRTELGLHIALTVLHVGALVASLAARPAAAFVGTTDLHVADASFAHLVAIMGLLGGTVLVTILHAALLHPRFAVVASDEAATWSGARA